jgi:signal transduction histidine kinase
MPRRQEISPEVPIEAGIRILLVEDSPTDAELIVRCLHHDRLAFTHRRVETADLLVRALAEFEPDILLCDNRLPGIDAASVIEIVGGMRPHIPVVIVTGTLDDEAAALLIKAGAVDFIRKDRLGRLTVAVTSALERADIARIRREQEAELRERELMLRLALNATDQGVWRWEVGQGADGFQWDAPCNALLGQAPDVPMNYAVWANSINEPDRAAALAGLTVALDPMSSIDDFNCDFRVAATDGPEIWLAAAGRAVFEPDVTEPSGRKAVRILGTIRDVSRMKCIEQERESYRCELERARVAAEQANNSKSRFLTTVTHELRTPLHGILGYAELLGLEGDLNDRQSEHVAAMIAAGEHLLRLINAVLDVSQIEADRLELHAVAIELSDFASSCVNLVRPAAETKGLALVLTAPEPFRISADVTRLRQVLLNLLGNAIKFTAAGRVELRLAHTQTGEFVRLEVADTGPGIWARHRDKLFETFERLNAEAVAGIEGAGLGLALSQRLVQAMGGRIGYEDNPGGGSVFWLELPATNAAPGASIAAASQARSARSGLRVLVADDDALNRDIARRFLVLGGHLVVCVDDGAAAVDAATADDFDVILMDVRMPCMNGLEATRRIRALPAPRGEVPVIALTAQAFAEQIEMCREAGMNSHVSKPFKQAVLLAAVEDAAPSPISAAPSALPPPATDQGPPVFDRAAFEDTTDCLAPGEAAQHLRTLLARGEALQGNLRAPDIHGRAGELAAAGHKLAGGAAMLGFLSLADSGRRFEVAADSGMPETAALADRLAVAIDGALAIIRQELADMANLAP